jgi:hypothetical protein
VAEILAAGVWEKNGAQNAAMVNPGQRNLVHLSFLSGSNMTESRVPLKLFKFTKGNVIHTRAQFGVTPLDGESNHL